MVKPYNKVFIIPLFAPLVLRFLNTACTAQEFHRSHKRARVTKTTIQIQTPSKVSEFDRDQEVVALLLTEMLRVKCKDVNKSKFGSFGSAILLLCSGPSVFALF